MELHKRKLARIYTNLRGWRTKRKIVVIESDDWGSIRMPSKDVYNKCLKEGYPVDKISFEKYDSLLSEEDLEVLFDLLISYKDMKGNHPIITANSMVANPDFEKIKENNFKEYYYELITDTFQKYPQHKNNFKLWRKGMELKVFHPQYHGREHLNVSQFMSALQKGDKDAHFGFSNNMPGCIPLNPMSGRRGNSYVVAMQYNSLKDKEDKLKIFTEGLDLFDKLFGYKSESIIPPNFRWSPDYNKAVYEKGVKYFQGIHTMFEPSPDGNKNIRHRYYQGKKNLIGQVFSVRNVTFEPSMFKLRIKDPVDQCLGEMNIAFAMHKPAVITSHRINFVGFIDIENRNRNLVMLNQILTKALKRWPDIEFMTSDQLGKLMSGEQS
jgi:hypothetical protein